MSRTERDVVGVVAAAMPPIAFQSRAHPLDRNALTSTTERTRYVPANGDHTIMYFVGYPGLYTMTKNGLFSEQTPHQRTVREFMITVVAPLLEMMGEAKELHQRSLVTRKDKTETLFNAMIEASSVLPTPSDQNPNVMRAEEIQNAMCDLRRAMESEQRAIAYEKTIPHATALSPEDLVEDGKNHYREKVLKVRASGPDAGPPEDTHQSAENKNAFICMINHYQANKNVETSGLVLFVSYASKKRPPFGYSCCESAAPINYADRKPFTQDEEDRYNKLDVSCELERFLKFDSTVNPQKTFERALLTQAMFGSWFETIVPANISGLDYDVKIIELRDTTLCALQDCCVIVRGGVCDGDFGGGTRMNGKDPSARILQRGDLIVTPASSTGCFPITDLEGMEIPHVGSLTAIDGIRFCEDNVDHPQYGAMCKKVLANSRHHRGNRLGSGIMCLPIAGCIEVMMMRARWWSDRSSMFVGDVGGDKLKCVGLLLQLDPPRRTIEYNLRVANIKLAFWKHSCAWFKQNDISKDEPEHSNALKKRSAWASAKSKIHNRANVQPFDNEIWTLTEGVKRLDKACAIAQKDIEGSTVASQKNMLKFHDAMAKRVAVLTEKRAARAHPTTGKVALELQIARLMQQQAVIRTTPARFAEFLNLKHVTLDDLSVLGMAHQGSNIPHATQHIMLSNVFMQWILVCRLFMVNVVRGSGSDALHPSVCETIVRMIGTIETHRVRFPGAVESARLLCDQLKIFARAHPTGSAVAPDHLMFLDCVIDQDYEKMVQNIKEGSDLAWEYFHCDSHKVPIGVTDGGTDYLMDPCPEFVFEPLFNLRHEYQQIVTDECKADARYSDTLTILTSILVSALLLEGAKLADPRSNSCWLIESERAEDVNVAFAPWNEFLDRVWFHFRSPTLNILSDEEQVSWTEHMAKLVDCRQVWFDGECPNTHQQSAPTNCFFRDFVDHASFFVGCYDDVVADANDRIPIEVHNPHVDELAHIAQQAKDAGPSAAPEPEVLERRAPAAPSPRLPLATTERVKHSASRPKVLERRAPAAPSPRQARAVPNSRRPAVVRVQRAPPAAQPMSLADKERQIRKEKLENIFGPGRAQRVLNHVAPVASEQPPAPAVAVVAKVPAAQTAAEVKRGPSNPDLIEKLAKIAESGTTPARAVSFEDSFMSVDVLPPATAAVMPAVRAPTTTTLPPAAAVGAPTWGDRAEDEDMDFSNPIPGQ
jgi:hypothetical protein